MPQGMLNRNSIAQKIAARRWAEKAIVAGRLTVHELKDADCTAYALVEGGISTSAVHHPHPSARSNVHVSPGPILAAAGGHVPDGP